jgi:hypothetical protein
MGERSFAMPDVKYERSNCAAIKANAKSFMEAEGLARNTNTPDQTIACI